MKRQVSHINFHYIIRRVEQIIYQKTNPDNPWLCRDAIVILEKLLSKDDLVLEFGSGRSTKSFSKRCKYVYSIEHNPDWYLRVKKT